MQISVHYMDRDWTAMSEMVKKNWNSISKPETILFFLQYDKLADSHDVPFIILKL